jgi:diguanylate cyclase (GGDEF)-like protein
MVDLDDFKKVNDRYGHETGDAVLRYFSRELTEQVRSDDLPARFGGDEFVVLMSGVDAERADTISDQLMDHFENVVYQPEGLALRCRISVGHAQIETGSETPASVLTAADHAMYEVKRSRKPGD